MRSLLTVGVWVCAQLFISAPALAQDDPSPSFSHVRAEATDLRTLIEEAAGRSPTFRALVDQIQRSDLAVYVRSSTRGARFLVIELACGRPRVVLMATLAHEMYHAVEIADAPWVVGASTLAQHDARIGTRTDGGGPTQTFETRGACDAAARVRREIMRPAATMPP